MAALNEVRTALDRYQNDHDGVCPGLEVLQMLERSSQPVASRPLVGYLDRIPDNPFTNGNHVGSTDEQAGAADWIYDSVTGVFKANDSAEHREL